MALGNIHQLKKYWIFADCQISQHTLHGTRQGCSTDTLNLSSLRRMRVLLGPCSLWSK
jgi:hypothetical protein